MSRNYKFHNPDGVYFVSFAVVEWIEVFKATRGDSCGSGELRYFFRVNSGVTKESQVLKFKSMLKNNDVETLFNSNQNLFKTFDKANGNGKINIWEDLEDLFNSSNFNENHPFFTFIEVL